MQLLKRIQHIFHPQQSNNHRPTFLHPKQLFFLTLIAVGFYQAVGLTATIHPNGGNILGYASNITVFEVVEQTNQQRVGSGLGELRYNETLAQAATAKAQNMFSENYWSHTSPTGVEPWDFIKSAGYTYRIAGENLARDFDTTSPMVRAWMNSPTHRANIMNPRYEEIGIAVVDGILEGVETTLVVQMFGTPSQVAQQPSITVPAQVSDPAPAQVAGTQDTESIEVLSEQPDGPAVTTNGAEANAEVLAEQSVPQGQLANGILYSPKHLLQAFFLSIILVLVTVLIYDAVVIGHRKTIRFVGKNMAHIMLFVTVAYLILAFKGGVVGP